MRLSCYLSLLAPLILLSGCQKPTSVVPRISNEELSQEEFTQKQIADAVKARGGMRKNWKNHPNMRLQFERVGERIEEAGAKLCRELNLQDSGCYYYFEMSTNNAINSHADGKKIVIYTGMMRFVESDDELAVVIAHEFAHNLMGHVQAQKNNGLIGTLLGATVDAIAASQGINTSGSAMQAGADIGVLSYSAEFEQEADYIGLYIMARAGYDITKSPVIWRRMSIENPEKISLESTHPSNAARFISLQKTISEIKYKRQHKLPLVPDFRNDS